MKTEISTLHTEAVYSDDYSRRYVLRKLWDDSKPKLAIILLAAGTAGTVMLDKTTQLVINNSARLGYGSVSIMNLSAVLNDYNLHHTEDPENIKVIVEEAKTAEKVVFSPGTGKSNNANFIRLQEQVLLALRPYEDKLHCLCNADGGARLQHPLSPQVQVWNLSPLKVSELVTIPEETEQKPKKKVKPKESKEPQKETPAE